MVLPTNRSPTNDLLQLTYNQMAAGQCIKARVCSVAFGAFAAGGSVAYNACALLKTPLIFAKLVVFKMPYIGKYLDQKLPSIEGFEYSAPFIHAYKIVGYALSIILTPTLGLINPNWNFRVHEVAYLAYKPLQQFVKPDSVFNDAFTRPEKPVVPTPPQPPVEKPVEKKGENAVVSSLAEPAKEYDSRLVTESAPANMENSTLKNIEDDSEDDGAGAFGPGADMSTSALLAHANNFTPVSLEDSHVLSQSGIGGLFATRIINDEGEVSDDRFAKELEKVRARLKPVAKEETDKEKAQQNEEAVILLNRVVEHVAAQGSTTGSGSSASSASGLGDSFAVDASGLQPVTPGPTTIGLTGKGQQNETEEPKPQGAEEQPKVNPLHARTNGVFGEFGQLGRLFKK